MRNGVKCEEMRLEEVNWKWRVLSMFIYLRGSLLIVTRLIDSNNSLLNPLNNNNWVYSYHEIITVLMENQAIHESCTIGLKIRRNNFIVYA